MKNTKESPNLKIFGKEIGEYILYSMKNPQKFENRYIIFSLGADELNRKNGRKIQRLLNILEEKGIVFKLSPIPVCLFSSPKTFFKRYSENLLNNNLKQKFFTEGASIKAAITKGDKKILNKGVIFERCTSCSFLGELCGGIYLIKYSDLEWNKLKKWFLNPIKKFHGNLLDVGCGDIPFFNQYRSSMASTFAIDPNLENKFLLEERIKVDFKRKIKIIKARAENMPFKDSKFKIVFFHYSYAHIEDLDGCLKELRRIMKTEGTLIIFDNLHEDSEETTGFYKHFRNHDLKEASNKVEQYFEIIDSFEFISENENTWGIKAIKRN